MGSLFFILLFLTLMSLSSLPVWKEDRLLLKSERASRVYSVDAYFVSIFTQAYFSAHIASHSFDSFHGMIGLNEGGDWNLS